MQKAINTIPVQWQSHLESQWNKNYMKNLNQFLNEQKKLEIPIYPKESEYFAAFNLTPFNKVKVVILGQDPYHGQGQAHGLSFSVKPEVIYAVDLDTMLAAKIYSVLRRLPLVYDSHEYFTEVPELSGRPLKKAIWTAVGKLAINENTQCITVNHSLAQLLEEKYGVPFTVIRNIPPQVEEIHFDLDPTKDKKIIVYLGAVNEGRGIELFCQAAHEGYLDDYDLWIIGNGDLLPQLLNQYKKQKNIVFYDWVAPDQLSALLSKCWIGLNLLDAVSQSYYYSLTNKYFDYCHHGLPALHMDYPEYRQLQELYHTSYLVPSYDLKALLTGIQHFEDPAEYKKSKLACKEASLDLNWENESQKLNEISDSL